MYRHATDGNIARVKIVYISEAHASDEWLIGSKFCYPQAKTLEQRAQAAADFMRLGLRVPVVLADIDGNFEKKYVPWPFRFFIIEKGKIVSAPVPIGEVYDLCEIWEFFDMKESSQKSTGDS